MRYYYVKVVILYSGRSYNYYLSHYSESQMLYIEFISLNTSDLIFYCCYSRIGFVFISM